MESTTERTGLAAADWVAAAERKRERTGVTALRAMPRPAQQVAELPFTAAPVIPAHLTMAAARKIAELKRSLVLLVERDGVLAGIIDQHKLLASSDDLRAGDAMRPLEMCLSATTTLVRARELFVRTGSAALPVAAGAFLLGVVTRAAVDRALRDAERVELDAGRGAATRGRPDTVVVRRRKAA